MFKILLSLGASIFHYHGFYFSESYFVFFLYFLSSSPYMYFLLAL